MNWKTVLIFLGAAVLWVMLLRFVMHEAGVDQ